MRPKRLGLDMLSFLALAFSVLCGCTTPYMKEAFPSSALAKINRTVSFSQVKENPSSHQGTIIIVGGEVLSAKRLSDRTQLTILQLPLTDYDEPTTERTQSAGRFQAVKMDFLDPAIVPAGTRVTIIGAVSGTVTEMLDEMEYAYPVITIQHFTVWPEPITPPRYWYAPYGYGPYYPYRYHRGYYGPYYGPYGYWW